MKKRIVVLLLSLALLFSAASYCFASSGAEISGDTFSTTAGQTVEYRVSIHGNPGLSSYIIRLTYDKSVFSAVTLPDSQELNLKQGDFTSQGSTIGSTTKTGCQIAWNSQNNAASDGTLFIIQLRVSDTAALGTYPITLSYSAENTINYSEEKVPLNCVSGSIKIRQFVPTIYGSESELKQGDEFDFSVSLIDNPGLASCAFTVSFDPTCFEFAVDASGNPIYSSEVPFQGGTLQNKFYTSSVNVLWYSNSNVVGSGTIFKVRLKAKSGAPLGEKAITITRRDTNILNEEEQPVIFASTDGKAVIASSAEVSVTAQGANSALITVAKAPAAYALAGAYDQNGKMLACSFSKIQSESAQLTLSSPAALSGCTIKVFLLDNSWTPICAALIQNEY